jgi:hypothetical protein
MMVCFNVQSLFLGLKLRFLETSFNQNPQSSIED